MATFGNYPPQYLVFNQQLSKQLAIVMTIEGVDTFFGISQVFSTVRYGDPGVVYGLPGLVYGGLRAVGGPNGTGGIQPWIMLDAGMMVQQRIEPEQGKGNIGGLSMTLIDFQGQVSFIIAPGNVVDEIMTSKQVTIYLGFQQTSFREDYLILFRGYITQIDCPPAMVRFQLQDATMKARQPLFSTPTTITATSINNSQTNIPVVSNTGFYAQILGPDSTFSSTVHTYIKIDDEYMEYGPSGMPNPSNFTVTRGVLGTVAATHSAATEVDNSIQFGADADGAGINFVTLALQLLLSGWNGPCETGIVLQSLGFAGVTAPNSFVLVQDAFLDLGLTVGDFFTISGSSIPGNNVSGMILGFGVLPNNISPFTQVIITNQTFTVENPTPATASFRSKYDVLPVLAGSKCRMRDVDVETMEFVRQTYFTASIYDVAMFYNSPTFAKDTIAADLFLPMGCYNISRYGRYSMSVTKPPLPGIGKLVQLDFTNILDPDKIIVTRSTNNRTFYNSVSYQYDFDPVSGNFRTVQYFVDTDSLNTFDQTLALPIEAKALKTTLGGGSVASIRGQALLSRYKNIALMIEMTVNWSAGSLIEVSDIVLVVDNGNLKIMNFETGQRNLGSQLFEVIDRQYNVTQGNVKLKLLGGLGFSVNSRFGLVSPSSNINSSSSGTLLRLLPSFGQTTIAAEIAKWTPFLGLPIVVHNQDYSTVGTSTLVSVDISDPTALDISPDLGFDPSGMILEIASYPTGTNPNTNSQYKALYASFCVTVPVISGVSTTSFTVSSGDISKFIPGGLLVMRKTDWSDGPVGGYNNFSIVSAATGTNLVTVSKSFGFTPNNTYVSETGFPDGGGFYRYD